MADLTKNPDIRDILDTFANPRRDIRTGSRLGGGTILRSIGDLTVGDRSP